MCIFFSEDFMTISQRVFYLLDKQGKKQNELSRFTGISTSTISAWNKRGTDPAADTISTIADFFGVSTNYILTGQEKESLSINESEMLEVFKKFDEREQIKLIGKLEELYRQKQIKEKSQPSAFKVARSTDGTFKKTDVSDKELERIHNLPIDTDF